MEELTWERINELGKIFIIEKGGLKWMQRS